MEMNWITDWWNFCDNEFLEQEIVFQIVIENLIETWGLMLLKVTNNMNLNGNSLRQ